MHLRAFALSLVTKMGPKMDQTEESLFKATIASGLARKIKGLQRGKHTLEKDLSRCLEWEKVQHEAELLQANFYLLKKGLLSIAVTDWVTDQTISLKLDSTLTPQEEVALRFKQCKKMKRGIEPLRTKIQKIEEQIKKQELLLEELNSLEDISELEAFQTRWCPPEKSLKEAVQEKQIKKALPYREFISANGIKIWVGKSARDNDKLTFVHANGLDWWLHVDGYSGSHVVIKSGKNEEVDEETLEDALQLALHYSQAKSRNEAEICLTQTKYVKPAGRGMAGKVQLSKHRRIKVRADRNRLDELKSRKN